jgi:UDP-N-acetyl-D-glucosamine dehydrogenase
VLEEQVDARVRLVEASRPEVETADAVVLLVDHSAFNLDELASWAKYFFDTRHQVTAPSVEYL